ncbi:MAG: hypothetical protein ACJ73S_08140 [Mycobacteriales bacterium]
MAEAWLCSGVDPDAPEDVLLVVVVDPEGEPGERAVARLGLSAYEGETAFHLAPADGWAERRLDGDTLTVDVIGAGAVRLLRVAGTVDPAEYARAGPATVVWEAPAGTPAEQVIAGLRDQADLPLILAPGP